MVGISKVAVKQRAKIVRSIGFFQVDMGFSSLG